MNQMLNVVPHIEAPLPLPPDGRGKRQKRVNYEFGTIPVGGNGRFTKSLAAVRKRLQAYQREHPEQRFAARAITKTMTRVWRLA